MVLFIRRIAKERICQIAAAVLAALRIAAAIFPIPALMVASMVLVIPVQVMAVVMEAQGVAVVVAVIE